MYQKYLQKISIFFTPKDIFTNEEWILKHQIFALLLVSFSLGVGIFFFAIYRVTNDNIAAGVAQFIFSAFLLFGFIKLRKDKTFYKIYSMLFFFFFFVYIHIVFFFVPQNHLNILWIVTAPVLIFFFLDKKGGLVFFVLLLGFMGYLLVTRYPYTIAEYITLFATLSTTTLIMYAYEKVKEAERSRLLNYNAKLKKEIESKTQKLKQLNTDLEIRVREEVDSRMLQEEMLLRQSRMASMGSMIDAIAHQWRQPLMNINAVMMNIDRGIETGREVEVLKEKVLEVFGLTAHMSHTIEDFRNLLKVEKEKQVFGFDGLIVDVLDLMKNTLTSVDVAYIANGVGDINTYKSELAQVLITLISNASEALHIKEIEEKKIVISAVLDDGKLHIDISDNAGGIVEDDLSKIFDPYFTSKKQEGGTGLGLYIARIIIEQSMEGELLVHNIDDGANFEISIPV